MSRIRTIKPEFCVSEQLSECSPNARLVFALMWMFCDDQGIHPAKPKTLKGEIFPLDDAISGKHVEQWMGELISAGLVREYEVNSEFYWIVTGWAKHQRIEKPTRKYPLPLTEESPKPRRVVEEPSTTEGNGREGKGEEQKTQKRIPEVPTSAAPRPPAAPFPASDDPRVQSMHGLAIGLGIRPNLLHVQQWVADGLTEDQLGAALAKAQSKKPGQTIPLNFLQCFIAEIRATHYDAEAVRNATIAGIAAREGHVAH